MGEQTPTSRLIGKMQRFDVSVVTGDKECAGTDANVFINVIGSLGKTGAQKLSKSSATHLNKFERGNTDTFVVQTPIVGKITAVEISHDSWGMGSSWYLESIEVKTSSNEGGDQTCLVMFNQWLDKTAEADTTRIRRDVV